MMHEQRSKVNFLQYLLYILVAVRNLSLDQAVMMILNFYLDSLRHMSLDQAITMILNFYLNTLTLHATAENSQQQTC